MNHHRYHRNKRAAASQPTVFAWLMLLAAWLSVIPFSVYLFRITQTGETSETQYVFAQVTAMPTDAEQTFDVEQATRSLACISKILPAVNPLRSDKPTILIYHTHTTEAYTQTETETYQEAGKWRTKDNTKNVVAVGERLKEILERDYGFLVIHDTTDHEPPKLATAYERSLKTMERYHTEYPSIVLFIDLHRDAYAADNAPCDYLSINGTETARLMLVVGKGEKYEDKPYFESNLALARRMTEYLNSIDSKLCRPIREKTGRYNQHVAPNCILVEVGHNANTLFQALAAMPYLAESIAYSFSHGSIQPADWLPN